MNQHHRQHELRNTFRPPSSRALRREQPQRKTTHETVCGVRVHGSVAAVLAKQTETMQVRHSQTAFTT